MKPSVEAALISGGWATVVAALGYIYNRVTASATIRATNANALAALDAAHAAQLWEKQADSYVEGIAVITRRHVARQHMTSPLRWDEATEEKLRQLYADPDDWDWANVSSRLTAYASQPVLEALHAAVDAHNLVGARLDQRKALTEQVNASGPGGPSGDQLKAAFDAIKAATAAADAADDTLERLIRADLERKPSEAGFTRPGASGVSQLESRRSSW